MEQWKLISICHKKWQKNWPQILAILIGSIPAMVCGMLFAWNSPSIPQIIEDKVNYDISLEQASYFTVIPPIMSLICSILYSKLNDIIGRKWTLLSIAIPHCLAWILIATASSVWQFYVARALVGMADSCLFVSLAVYIGEVATPKIRGTWGNSMTFCIYFGQLIINVIGSQCNVEHTAYIGLVLPLSFAVMFVFMPESPYYLVMKERFDDARTALQQLRRIHNVEDELNMIKKDVERQLSESGTWKDLFKIKSNRRALYAGIFLRSSQQLAGTAVFAVYTVFIFKKAGGDISPSTSAIIYTSLITIFNFFAGYTIEKFGRKKSYLVSIFCSSWILLIEAIYFFIDQYYSEEVDLSSWNWIPLAGMIVFVFFYSFGLGIVPTLMLGELFSVSIKGKGLCVLNIVFGISVSVVTKLFQVLETNVGMYCPFLFFAASCFVSTFITMRLVPETKGKTLEEIQQVLKGNKKRKSIASNKVQEVNGVYTVFEIQGPPVKKASI